MTRFGDFTIQAQIGASSAADLLVASHDSLGGPFFVKRYARLKPDLVRDLIARGDSLVGLKSPNVLEHLGHGVVETTAFTVSPIVEGIDLRQLITSLRTRRVALGLDQLLYIVQQMAQGILAFRAIPSGPAGAVFTHGDMSAPHVRITRDGGVILTGALTPRGRGPGVPSAPVWDGAGVAAAVYDLLPLLRPGPNRPSLPPALERVVRRSLGIVPAADAIPPELLLEQFEEAATMLGVTPDRTVFARVAARSIDAVHKVMEEDGTTPIHRFVGVVASTPSAADRAADALPMLEPINLEPIAELSPSESLEGETEARVEIVSLPPEPARVSPAVAPAAMLPPDQSLDTGFDDESPVPAIRTRSPASTPAARTTSPTPSPAPRTHSLAPMPAPRVEPSRDALATPAKKAPVPAESHSLPTDETTFPSLPTPSIAAPFPPLDRDASKPLNEPTATQSLNRSPATTTGPDQSAISTQSGPDPLEGSTRDELENLFSVDADDVLEIPAAPKTETTGTFPGRPPASTQEDDSPLGPLPAVETSNSLLTDAASSIERPPAEGRSAAKPPRVKSKLIGSGLFADPPDEPINQRSPLVDVPSKSAAREFQDLGRSTATDDDTDPGSVTAESNDASQLSESGEDDAEGFVEEKTLPNMSLNVDTDAEQAMKAKAGDPAESSPTPVLGRAVAALVERKLITTEHVKTAVAALADRGGRLLEILVQLQAVHEDQVADILAEAAMRPRITKSGLTEQLPDSEICRRLPQTYALSRRLLPLSVIDGVLSLAVVDPFADADIEEVRTLLRADKVNAKVATRSAIMDAVTEAYRRAGLLKTGTGAVQGILLCTRDDALSERIGQRLVTEGFSIELANSSSHARAALENRIAHAIVCDTQLVGDEDQTLLRFARGTENLEDIPFFLYGPEDETLEARVLDLGADDVFTVPFSLDVLVKKLRRAVNKTAASTDARLKKEREKQVPPPAAKPAEPTVGSLLDEAPPVEAPLSIPRMVTMVGAVAGLDALRDLPDLSDLSSDLNEAIDDEAGPPPPTDVNSDPFAVPESANPMGEPTGVMGTLRQMSVSEIVQSLELGRKSARVELVPTYGERGALAFLEGNVVYAECKDLRGEEAFYVLAQQQEGFFRIHYGVEPPETNIEKPSMFLLLEAARKADEQEEGIA